MNNLLKKSLLPIIIFSLLALLGWQLSNKPAAPEATFVTLDGKPIAMASLKGKVVIVNFWATDCPGCIKEMPELIRIYNQYHKKGLEIIAVAMHYDQATQVSNYSNAQSLPFPVMHDSTAEVSDKFGSVNLTPTAFIYNKQGHLLQRTMGELDFIALQKLLNKELDT
jgi:peroxiredoxin